MKRKSLRLSILNASTMLITLRIALRSGLVRPRAHLSRKALLKLTGLGLTGLATGGCALSCLDP